MFENTKISSTKKTDDLFSGVSVRYKIDIPTPCEKNATKHPKVQSTGTAMTKIEIRETADKIFDTMERINEVYRNKSPRDLIIFDSSYRWHSYYMGLLKVPHDEEEFFSFVNNVFKTFIEWRTPEGARLVSEFNNKHQNWDFHNTINGLRNDKMIHEKSVSRYCNYGKALKILQGHKNPPSTPDEYEQLHSSLLKMYLQELEFIYKKVKEMPD